MGEKIRRMSFRYYEFREPGSAFNLENKVRLEC